MEEIALLKAELRTKYLALRRKLEKKIEKDRAIFQNLICWDGYRETPVLLLYLSTKEEVDTRRILEHALSQGKTVYAPVCRREKEGEMDFYRVFSPDSLVLGAYHILEPKPEERFPAEMLSEALCVTPGVVFDRNGYRIGYGKGYYDRFFQNGKVRAVGLCYEDFLISSLPRECCDQRVEAVITEQSCWKIPENIF